MSVTSLDRCLTELAEEHERHRVILASLQGCTQLVLTDELRSQVDAGMASHRAYMGQVETTRAALQALKDVTAPELDSDLSAALRAQVEGVMDGLKPAMGQSGQAHDPEPPKEPPAPSGLETGGQAQRRGRPQE